MQLSPGVLRQKITNAPKNNKKKYVIALLLRDFCLLSFAIGYITTFISVFGNENSSVAVASFCMIISLHFVGFGFRASDGVIALAIVLLIMFIGSVLWFVLPTALGLVANLISILLILILTSSRPELGNAGVYVFSYIFITGMTVTGSLVITRGLAILTVFIMLSLILLFKHSANDSKIRLHHLFKQINLHSKTTQWHIRLALGISIVIAISDWSNLNRPVWLGYACMSILLPQTGNYLKRAHHRLAGIVFGSLLFIICTNYLPESILFILAPAAGFCLGLTINYFLHSLLNCFGALTLATSIYGLSLSGSIRIWDNFIGISIALIFAALFEIILKIYQKNHSLPLTNQSI